MTHSARFGYRFFAYGVILALAGCFSTPPEPEKSAIPESPPPGAVGPDASAPQAPPSHGMPPEPEVPPPAAPAEEFAPRSHVADAPTTPPASLPGGFAPASHVGEAAKAVTVKVGLLIPMSGSAAPLGQSLLDAAVLAIYDKYSTLSPREITAKVEILPKDTSDTIEGAEKAAQDAIQDGATLLLGPIFSKQVASVAAIAKHQNVPVITFSNNASVISPGVYLFGFLPEQQVIRIVDFALHRKVSSIAALVPSDPYGAAIVKQLSAEVRKTGGRAHPIEYYQEDLSTIDTNVGRLGRYLQEQPHGIALFLAEGGPKLKYLSEHLAANGVTAQNVQLLGTGLWDDTDILKWPAMAGGWFASSPPERYHAFEQHFALTYGYRPDRRASLSYDAVALAESLAITAKGGPFTPQLFQDPVGFNGPANGIFRFHDDGSIERGLSVLQITPQGFQTIDPAPALFDQ